MLILLKPMALQAIVIPIYSVTRDDKVDILINLVLQWYSGTVPKFINEECKHMNDSRIGLVPIWQQNTALRNDNSE